jgi:hypothetical protein
MRATSIQQSGTATTTLACPSPSGSRNSTEPSTSVSADQILAGDTEMHAARLELVHDLRSRAVDHVDLGKCAEAAAIVPLMPGLAQGKLRAIEQAGDLILEPPLRGNGDAEGCACHHWGLPTAASRRSV